MIYCSSNKVLDLSSFVFLYTHESIHTHSLQLSRANFTINLAFHPIFRNVCLEAGQLHSLVHYKSLRRVVVMYTRMYLLKIYMFHIWLVLSVFLEVCAVPNRLPRLQGREVSWLENLHYVSVYSDKSCSCLLTMWYIRKYIFYSLQYIIIICREENVDIAEYTITSVSN